MSEQQTIDLARPFVKKVQTIVDYYENPENERAFQEWYLQKYGKKAPKGV